jgi:hypothetical protein
MDVGGSMNKMPFTFFKNSFNKFGTPPSACAPTPIGFGNPVPNQMNTMLPPASIQIRDETVNIRPPSQNEDMIED